MSKLFCEKGEGDICCFSKGLNKGVSFEFRMVFEVTQMMYMMNQKEKGAGKRKTEPKLPTNLRPSPSSM